MVPGALGMAFNDRKRTLDYHLSKQVEIQCWDDSVPMAAQQFGGAGVEYQRLHGTPDEVFGMIAVKARRRAANNPLAIFREHIRLDAVMASERICGLIHRFHARP